MPIPPTPSANQMHRPYQLSGSTVCLRGTLCGECALLLSVHSNSIPRISPVLPSQSNRLLCLHIGHCPLEESCLSHSTMQCYSHQLRPRHRTCSLLTIWKLCPHLPETGVCVSSEKSRRRKEGALTQDAIISGVFACWTCTIEVDLADAADVVVGNIPSPCSYGIPFPDLDLHLDCTSINSVYTQLRYSIRRLEKKD
jgi:hypothetical protein